jgi:hypothetical protein
MAKVAIPADANLDGVQITGWKELRIVVNERRSLRASSSGRVREVVQWQDYDLPPVKRLRKFSFKWDPGINDRDLVEELIAVPGEHELAVWRHENFVWLGDGATAEFRLPNEWRNVADVISPLPTPLDTAKLQFTLRLGYSGTTVAVSSQVDATYDAGSPGAGEAWVREGGSDVKLGDIAGSGVWIYARVVPVYLVFLDTISDDRTLGSRGPMLEPFSLSFVEAG